MAYRLEGRILEVCDCNVLCPCWIGEDPDGGTCDAALAYHIDKGEIEGVDVSGLTLATIAFIPGNVLEGHFRSVWFINDHASDDQFDAIVRAFKGELGGPLEHLAQLTEELVAIERAPIVFTVDQGQGTFQIGSSDELVLDSVLDVYRGPTGTPTTLVESVFSTIPGSPAMVGKAEVFKRNSERYGLRDVHLEGHNAIQGSFHFEA